jgi:hypothetical protein
MRTELSFELIPPRDCENSIRDDGGAKIVSIRPHSDLLHCRIHGMSREFERLASTDPVQQTG